MIPDVPRVPPATNSIPGSRSSSGKTTESPSTVGAFVSSECSRDIDVRARRACGGRAHDDGNAVFVHEAIAYRLDKRAVCAIVDRLLRRCNAFAVLTASVDAAAAGPMMRMGLRRDDAPLMRRKSCCVMVVDVIERVIPGFLRDGDRGRRNDPARMGLASL